MRRAEADSAEAIEAWQHEGEQSRSLDDEALAHVYMATARLKLGEIEGAMSGVRPILDLPPERQISWIKKRVSELSGILEAEQYANSQIAADAHEELRAYGC